MSGHSFIPYPVVISSPLLDRLPSCDEKEKRFISYLQALVRIFNGRFFLVTNEPLLNLTFPYSYITVSVLFPTQIRGKSLAYVVNILKSLFE